MSFAQFLYTVLVLAAVAGIITAWRQRETDSSEL